MKKFAILRFLAKSIEAIVIIFVLSIGFVLLFSLLPFEGNYKTFAVMSGSMRPTIDVGSLVFAREQKTYQINDIVSFDSDQSSKTQIVTHRIVEIVGDGPLFLFKTKGDANDYADGILIPSSAVRGRVVFVAPKIGYVLGATKTLPGLIIIIIIPSTIIVYEEMKKIHSKVKKAVASGRKRRSA
ncbi:MAG: Signal peptidase I W [candidate division WS2 bacterium ADurb.Bin280]|uniref:Signal peptidase I n=1 Tax=candidate division WS2 bacterium ADurb.Bin280 TaxID=1852829 RepID=A0A1V5SDG3_9BACT|nr:MAG: Signal peptidase I W [candidate division WS2 bacterium ADurb.Bin280]